MASSEGGAQQRLLIVVSDRAGLGRNARAGERHVRRWAGGRADPDGTGDAYFHGDPADAATYAFARDAASVSAVIDLESDAIAAGVLDALRSVRDDAAVLVLSEGIEHPPGDGTLTRKGDLRDVVRLDLDEELQRLEAERRAHRLREFVAGVDVVPVLVHPDPDPDAISSALALRTILQRPAESLPIVTLRAISRTENRRMVDLLRVTVTEVTDAELRSFPRLISVDSQPTRVGDAADTQFAVIDHHPQEDGYHALFCDIRPRYGATATMMTEYLRVDARIRIGEALATALLYGIKTDTDGLVRGVSPADVDAYAFLQRHADPTLLRRFERPAYPPDAVQAYGRAIAAVERDNDLAVANAGELHRDRLHVLADLGDFCVGIEGVTWAIAAAVIDDTLVLTIRHLGRGRGAGALAGAIAEAVGGDASGGGHASMGRATLPLGAAAHWLGGDGIEPARIVQRVRAAIDALGAGDGKEDSGSGGGPDRGSDGGPATPRGVHRDPPVSDPAVSSR